MVDESILAISLDELCDLTGFAKATPDNVKYDEYIHRRFPHMMGESWRLFVAEVDHCPNRFTFMHQIKGFIDLFQW